MFIMRDEGGGPSGGQPAGTGKPVDPQPKTGAGEVTTGEGSDGGEGSGEEKITFTPEQQTAINKLVAERLDRAKQAWQEETSRKAEKDTETAEAQRLAGEKKFEELAQKLERKKAELEKRLAETEEKLTRATGIVEGLLESKKKGLPDPIMRLLDDRDLFEQFEIVDAYAATQPAGTNRTSATQPTPVPQQSGGGDHVQQAIERQHQRAGGGSRDPYEAMFKR